MQLETDKVHLLRSAPLQAWTVHEDKDIILRGTPTNGPTFASFPLPNSAIDFSYYISDVQSERGSVQNIAHSEVRKPVWVQVYQNDRDRAEAVRNVRESQELKNVETISIRYEPPPYEKQSWYIS